jgi:hypothetical protein
LTEVESEAAVVVVLNGRGMRVQVLGESDEQTRKAGKIFRAVRRELSLLQRAWSGQVEGKQRSAA